MCFSTVPCTILIFFNVKLRCRSWEGDDVDSDEKTVTHRASMTSLCVYIKLLYSALNYSYRMFETELFAYRTVRIIISKQERLLAMHVLDTVRVVQYHHGVQLLVQHHHTYGSLPYRTLEYCL